MKAYVMLDFPERDGRRRELYAVTALDPLGRTVLLNGERLALPVLRGVQQDEVRLEPLSYAFVRLEAG